MGREAKAALPHRLESLGRPPHSAHAPYTAGPPAGPGLRLSGPLPRLTEAAGRPPARGLREAGAQAQAPGPVVHVRGPLSPEGPQRAPLLPGWAPGEAAAVPKP